MRDPRLLLLIPLLLVGWLVVQVVSPSPSIDPALQQRMAASHLGADLPEGHPGAMSNPEGDPALKRRIKRVRPDGQPEATLLSPVSAAVGVGGGILFLGGFAAFMLWRQAGRSA